MLQMMIANGICKHMLQVKEHGRYVFLSNKIYSSISKFWLKLWGDDVISQSYLSALFPIAPLLQKKGTQRKKS